MIISCNTAVCLQCFDDVDWAAEGHLACKKLSGGVLAHPGSPGQRAVKRVCVCVCVCVYGLRGSGCVCGSAALPVNGDWLCQWERAIFDPTQIPQP